MQTLQEKIQWLADNCRELDGKEQGKLASLVSTAQERLQRNVIMQRCYDAEAAHPGQGRELARLHRMKKPGRSATLDQWRNYEDDTLQAVAQLEAALERGRTLASSIADQADEGALATLAGLDAAAIRELNLACPLFRHHKAYRYTAKMGKLARKNYLSLLRQRMDLSRAA
ncbi:MAG: hypothetical protein HS115_11635 [Spirochaetales bacterium]|nr:hypothetical protein [Spirochaetales bacterium]